MAGRLEGKVCVVTGASGGIGAATVATMQREGAKVAGVDLLEGAPGDLSIAADVTSEEQVADYYRQVKEAFGRIDVLFNNAGISPDDDASVLDTSVEAWQRVQDVNLKSVFLCCKHGIPYLLEKEGPLRASQLVAPIMRDGGGGSIINIGTMAAYSGGSNICAYGASKAGLLNLTKSMAMEFAPWKVRVNLLSPGPFMSEMMAGGAKTQPGYLDLVAGGTLQKRVADPSEIVGPVLYLASDAASFVTGDDLSVSGGMHK